VETTLLEDPNFQSDCRLLWRVWLKTLNLALVGGNPHYFSMLFNLVCAFCSVLCVFQVKCLPFKFGGVSPTLCLTCAFPLVLYFFVTLGTV
jgi:hypothetical protein